MTTKQGRRILTAVLFAAGLVAVVAILPSLAQRLSGDAAVDGVAGGQGASVSTVQTIEAVGELRTAFNQDAGKVRAFLFLSPT